MCFTVITHFVFNRLKDIADTLAYCYKFLRSAMMERLASHLASTVAQCNQNSSEWPRLEACLHALKVRLFFKVWFHSRNLIIHEKIGCRWKRRSGGRFASSANFESIWQHSVWFGSSLRCEHGTRDTGSVCWVVECPSDLFGSRVTHSTFWSQQPRRCPCRYFSP